MEKKWWKEAVVYQVYPISFKDSNGDGLGDLNGITSKLDYIKELGVDIIWVSPIYPSPNDDNGYDISNYRDIMPQFGTMADFDRLLAETHKRGMKLVMDLVVNHSSDEHEWFKQARSSKDNPYRDYYIWRDAKDDGTPPNNWTSYFSGSAWEYDEATKQYYLHLFTKKQPDLNWENPKLRQEIYDMMNFWFGKGIDGYRIDVLHGWAKTPGLPDGIDDGTGLIGTEHFCNLPHLHDYVQEMNREVFSKYDCVTVGETGGVTIADAQKYTAPERHEVCMVFQFQHVDIGDDNTPKWFSSQNKKVDMREFKGYLADWQRGLDGIGWNSVYMSNHDQPRQVSRFGNDKEYRVQSAKMLATMIHLQQGTPYVYQGEELGMTNVKFDSIDEARDLQALNAWKEFVVDGSVSPDVMLEGLNDRSRDNARTPMQWSAGENAGFSTAKPWIKVNPNHTFINVEAERNDPDSVLNYYKLLIAKRKQCPLVVYGDFKEYYGDSSKLFVFTRNLGNETLFVALNMTGEEVALAIPDDIKYNKCELYISNYPNDDELADCKLRPYEAIAYKLTK